MFEEGLNLLPCPHCGKPATLWAVDMSEGVYVFCDNCGMRGPLTEEMTEHAAITAWNALPRRLRPTTNAPTSGGWYYVRNKGHRHWRIIHIHEADLYDYTRFYADIETIAGPIPEPEEATT